jgi:hypothetical protein
VLLKGYALSGECASRNSGFEGFAETLVFLFVTVVAAGVLCFNSHELVNRTCLHIPCSWSDFIQIFQVKTPRNLGFCSNFQCPRLNSTGILLVFGSWLFKGNYTRFVSCFDYSLRIGAFTKGRAVLLQRFPQNHSAQQSTAANFFPDFHYLLGSPLPKRLV